MNEINYQDFASWFDRIVSEAQAGNEILSTRDPIARTIGLTVVGANGVATRHYISLSAMWESSLNQTLNAKGLREKFLDIALDRLPADTTTASAIVALAKELA